MQRLDDAEDKRLMAALAAGEDLALNRLIERWQAPVRHFILRFVQNDSDAEDLVQETFVRVYRHRSRYRPTSRFSTWLFTIAVNLCRNFAARRRRRPTVSLDEPPPGAIDGTEASASWREQPSPAPSPDASTLNAERAAAVRAAINELPPDLRSAVLLFEYEGLSHAEIAEIASATPKAIETRLYRARGLLRRKLARFLA